MDRGNLTYQSYLQILKRELVPAMGCTEPIAIAYCAAKARSILGSIPDSVTVRASGNIIKNAKSVVVPNTNGLRGIAAAAAAGILGGDESKGLEVIAHIPQNAKGRLREYMEQAAIKVVPSESGLLLDIEVEVHGNNSNAVVRITDEHTHITYIEKDGKVLEEQKEVKQAENGLPDYNLLTMEAIYDFAETAEIGDVKEILDRQIKLNGAIADEGMRGDYGAGIGKVLLESYGGDVKVRAKARAAAGSDARMNGCELPVVINSGSGNQGMTVSLPVMEYAKELGSNEEALYRALLISNLVTLHLKNGIGRLSAYCGAVSAGAGAGAGIAYLCDGDYDVIIHTVVNALAITSGIICDGAKSSCAAKIATAVDAGILGYEMYKNGRQFYGGDGVILKGVENTIKNIGFLGRVGMKETDTEIIRMMTAAEPRQ